MSNIKSGIYKIICIVTLDDYLGSAIKLSKREYEHFRDLRKGTHHNYYLQEAYNKYGPDNFIFEIIEYVDNKEDLITREQYYIDTFNPTYNVCKIAGSSLGRECTKETRLKMSEAKRNISEETRQKMSKASKGRKHTEETKRKISESEKGKKVSEETKRKISESKSGITFNGKGGSLKIFKLLSPQGLVIEGTNLAKFCKENNLHVGNMCSVIHNKRKSHKGWTKA